MASAVVNHCSSAKERNERRIRDSAAPWQRRPAGHPDRPARAALDCSLSPSPPAPRPESLVTTSEITPTGRRRFLIGGEQHCFRHNRLPRRSPRGGVGPQFRPPASSSRGSSLQHARSFVAEYGVAVAHSLARRRPATLETWVACRTLIRRRAPAFGSVRSASAAESIAACGNHQAQRCGLDVYRATNRANGYKRPERSSRCTTTCKPVKP